jgi:AraC-like DNA-binding protein
VTAGNCRFVQNGREYLVEPGMLFLQHKGATVSYSVGPAGFLHKRWVGIQGDTADALLDKCGLLEKDVCALPDARSFTAIMKQAHRMLRSRDPAYYQELSFLAYRVLLTVSKGIVGPNYPAPVQSALSYMQQHLFEQISVAKLATICGLSEPHFYRLFQKHMDDTPLHYFNALKLKHAAHLLVNTHKPIKEIVDLLGYQEPAYFSGQFKKAFGISPREHRKSFGEKSGYKIFDRDRTGM